MNLNHYETVFILNPVLPEEQVKSTVEDVKAKIAEWGGEVYHEEEWGLKKLAYPIRKHHNGFYALLEFKAPGDALKKFEVFMKRNESVIRFLVVSLDKHALAFSEKRRQGAFDKPKEEEQNDKNS